MPTFAGVENGGRIDHIGNSCRATEVTGFTNSLVVERFDVDLTQSFTVRGGCPNLSNHEQVGTTRGSR
jgi:hypothetical protein